MKIKSNNTFLKDVCMSLGYVSEYNQDELENNSYVISNSINANSSKCPLNSYGLISKNKLLYREPLILSSLKIHSRDELLSNKSEISSKVTVINSLDNKLYYSMLLEKIDHKYTGTIIRNISSSHSVNIFFPTTSSIVIISDNEKELNTYKKVFDKGNINNSKTLTISIPSKIEITTSKNNKKIVEINNSSFVSASIQLSDLIEENTLSSDTYVISNNQINFITKINLILLNFIPSFIAPILLKFFQTYEGSQQFHKQVLEINYLISRDNFKFADVFEYQNQSSYLTGSKILNLKFTKNTKKYLLKDLLTSEKNLLTFNVDHSSNFNGNKILISNKDFTINQHTFDLLKLNTFSILLSKTGLILEIFDNSLKNPFLENEIESSAYTDDKQLAYDEFNLNKFKPELPKIPKFKVPKISKFFKKA